MSDIPTFLNDEQVWWCAFKRHFVKQQTDTFQFPSEHQEPICSACKSRLLYYLQSSRNAEASMQRLAKVEQKLAEGKAFF